MSRDARLLNIHLWNLADDEGRLQELPQWIIGEIFPTDEDVTPVLLREWLQELSNNALIERYEVSGEAYIYCHGFNEHQVISHFKKSELPPPPKADSRAKKHSSSKAPIKLQEASIPEEEGEVEVEKEGEVAPPVPRPSSKISKTSSPLCFLLTELVASNGSKRPIVSADWATAEDRMLRLDKRDPAEAERLIRWCQASTFWKSNILSMPKFREKYDTLRLQAGDEVTVDLASKYAGREKVMEA